MYTIRPCSMFIAYAYVPGDYMDMDMGVVLIYTHVYNTQYSRVVICYTHVARGGGGALGGQTRWENVQGWATGGQSGSGALVQWGERTFRRR